MSAAPAGRTAPAQTPTVRAGDRPRRALRPSRLLVGRVRALLGAVAAAVALAGCATRPVAPPKAFERAAPQAAPAPAADGPLAALEQVVAAAHGPDRSGFDILDRNEDALRWRLALIDSARTSLDIQYYIWFGDDSGRLLYKRVLDAADRGVQVRVLIDDLNSVLRTAGAVDLRDTVLALFDAHPNVELRLFNPSTQRGLLARLAEATEDSDRLNRRMHNKALIADNRAAILGGRNLGDEYFGLHSAFNFRDLDLLGVGPVARQASAVFDRYWNSPWAVPIAAMHVPIDATQVAANRARLVGSVAQLPSLERFPAAPQAWPAELTALPARLMPGRSEVHADVPTETSLRHEMPQALYRLAGTAQRELLAVNAYVIPDERFVESLRTLKAKGVAVHLLTNSLASHDVPAVNSHYKAWRKPLREASASLHEMRHDAAVQPLVADTPPIRTPFMGLHSKAMVIDRERVFVGSMNFDPRSAQLNTEMGVFVESPALAQALATVIERDMQPANSWRVEIGPDGRPTWTNDRETVSSQPARNTWQRVEDMFFMLFPRTLY
jgi:putative cardiolipin synthase